MIALLQGIYYLITGLWPLIHMRSFEWVTGSKTDKWLVKATGIILADIGLVLIALPEGSMKFLGIFVAASLAGVDIYYGLKGTISKIYLADAALEILFVIAWIVMVFR